MRCLVLWRTYVEWTRMSEISSLEREKNLMITTKENVATVMVRVMKGTDLPKWDVYALNSCWITASQPHKGKITKRITKGSLIHTIKQMIKREMEHEAKNYKVKITNISCLCLSFRVTTMSTWLVNQLTEIWLVSPAVHCAILQINLIIWNMTSKNHSNYFCFSSSIAN